MLHRSLLVTWAAALVALLGLGACGDINVVESDSSSGTDAPTADPGGGPQPCQFGDDTTCDDGDTCTVDRCLITEVCLHQPLESACKIGATCYTNGTVNPGNSCQRCDIGTSVTAWSDLVCDDGEPCTSDACVDPEGCVATPDDAASCDDGDPCSTDDHCSGGTCVGNCTCTSDADCTGAPGPCMRFACQDSACVAVVDAALEGQACDDGQFCTTGETCSGGQCTGSGVVDCSASGDGICTVGACDEDSDACVPEPVEDDTVCDDEDLCTEDDKCTGGACAGTGLDCTGFDTACFEGTCDAGTCAAVVTVGAGCDDGDACTLSDTCDAAGACAGSWDEGCGCQTDAECGSLGDACNVGTCNTTSNTCTTAAVAGGATCDDGNACTHTDVCDGAGSCSGTAYTCTPPTACQSAQCAGDGACVHVVNAGSCLIDVGGVPKCFADGEANPSNPCQVCVAATATDAWSTLSDGQVCGDASGFCSEAGTCQGGTCAGGAPKAAGTPCGDQTATTCDNADLCDGGGTCLPAYAAAGLGCDDGDPTNVADACTGQGQCVGGACSADSDCAPTAPGPCFGAPPICVVSSGICIYPPKSSATPCDDGNPGTVGDRCDGLGTCTGNAPCTAAGCETPISQCEVAPGTCDNGTGICSYTLEPTGTACNDGNPATLGDRCDDAGVCKGSLDTPPWIAAVPDVIFSSGAAPPELRIHAGEGADRAEWPQIVSVSVASSSDPAIATVDDLTVVCGDAGFGCIGKLTFTGAFATGGTTTITLEVSDGVSTTQTSFTLTITTCLSQSETFTADGTSTVPAGCNYAIIEAWGGGGGGGHSDGGFLSNAVGGDGGAGGYAKRGVAVGSSGTLQIAIGGGGVGGVCSGDALGGPGTYAGGMGGDNGNAGLPGEGAGSGGLGGTTSGAGAAPGGDGGYGGGGGGAGQGQAGGGGGGATVVHDGGGAELIIAGGGGGGGGAEGNADGGQGGPGCGADGESLSAGDSPGGGGGGGACVGDEGVQGVNALPAHALGAAGAGGAGSNSCAPANGQPGAVVVTYRGDYVGGGLHVADGSAFEGDIVSLEVTVEPLDPAQPVTFSWTTRDLSARAGTDYIADSGVETLPAGTTSRLLSIATNDNNVMDGLRLFEIVLSNIGNAAPIDPVGLAMIGDDETCAAAGSVKDVDGVVLLGMDGRYVDTDGDGYTGPPVPTCVLEGAPLPPGASAVPLAPPLVGFNAKQAAGVGGDAWIGNVDDWTSEEDARVEAGDADCTNIDAGQESEYLKLQNWAIGAPAGATIVGVRAHVIKYAVDCNGGPSALVDAEIRLVVGGEVVGLDRASAGLWAYGTPAESVYGGPTDTWGLALTPAQVNAPDFGIVVRARSSAANCVARVSHVWLEVFLAQGEDCAPDDSTAWRLADLYTDADGDLYTVAPTAADVCLGDALPAGYEAGWSPTSWGDDCYDGNANAYPGATAYRTSDRGDGSYDWNCDGQTTEQATSCYSCSCSISGSCAAYTGTCASGPAAAQATYDCSFGPASCGASVLNSSCAVPRQLTGCTASSTTFSSGSGTSTTYCSATLPGYGNDDGNLADDVTYSNATCACR